ncbi:MAG: hypothetical protein ABFC90_03890 [Bacteroidales bacterium]|nr:hypothetical protein [Bacteroidales bacterium]MDD2612491.1 hypothetical protein [Bacteroidales bacterium]MDD3907817.1 hypothetical protein [Bacteroidales bacterium]MDD4713337.1 hypothetical protein [Bacteroidales bacterium]
MKAKNVFKGMVSLLVLAVAFSLSSCTQDADVLAMDSIPEVGQQVNVLDDANSQYSAKTAHSICGGISYKALYPGQKDRIGYIAITNNENFLYVKYHIDSANWVISETHLYVGSRPGAPVTKSGNPKVGNFPYSAVHNPTVRTYEYAIPLDSLGSLGVPYSRIIVASHAVVLRLNASNIVLQEETAWSGCIRFVEKGNWALYGEYIIQPCSNE